MSTGINGSSARANLPPLNETFPVEKFPRRELTGTGFTAQSVRGPEAEACSATASEMLMEWRSNLASSVSSEGSVSQSFETEPFVVPDLPLPDRAFQDGLLILRNEAIFPGMVGVSVPGRDTLWLREDGTFNFSGFFRRQIPKFETAAVVAAAANMSEFLDVYHAMYRPALEAAAGRQQFKVMRAVIEAGMKYYQETNSPQRQELVELRRRVMALRSQVVDGMTSCRPNEKQPGMTKVSSAEQLRLKQDNSNDSWVSTEEVMEIRRRLSDSKHGSSIDGLKRHASEGMPERHGDSLDVSVGARSARSTSGNERSSKIAEQIVTGAAPKQKSPFRLWKSDIGGESYDKSRPS